MRLLLLSFLSPKQTNLSLSLFTEKQYTMVLSSVPASARLEDKDHPRALTSLVYGGKLNAPRFELAEEELPAATAARFVSDEVSCYSIYTWRLLDRRDRR